MGVLNVTPDSFQATGRFPDPAQAIAHALGLLDAGAKIIDVGGESTRPGASVVSLEE
jgi:dihydropteroate synthase